MIVCIHGRSAADPLGTVECLDCEELAALLLLEKAVRSLTNDATEQSLSRISAAIARGEERLDAIRRRKGIGALGHPETRATVIVGGPPGSATGCTTFGPQHVIVGCDDGEVVTTRERARELFGHGSLMGEHHLPFRVRR